MSSEAKDQIQSGAGDSNVTESIKDRAENVMDKLKDNEDHKPQTLGDRVDQMKERQSEVLSGKTSDIHTARPIMPDVGTASDPGEKAARGQAMTNVPEAQDALN